VVSWQQPHNFFFSLGQVGKAKLPGYGTHLLTQGSVSTGGLRPGLGKQSGEPRANFPSLNLVHSTVFNIFYRNNTLWLMMIINYTYDRKRMNAYPARESMISTHLNLKPDRRKHTHNIFWRHSLSWIVGIHMPQSPLYWVPHVAVQSLAPPIIPRSLFSASP
jgi:hypothetical protein